jgi:nucleotide-binding universal stress UspA family protein
MKTLLVPTDFSAISRNAISYAMVLAKKLDAKITLLHAHYVFPVDPGYISKRNKEEVEIFRKKAEIKIKAQCEEIEDISSCKCDFILSDGLPVDVIVSYAHKTKPDLLIIGTEDHILINQLMFGTITGKVIKETDCTLLVIPEKAQYKPPKKIAFAMDYHDSDIEDILYVTELAQKFKSEIHIIHVVSDDENEKFEENFFDDFKQEVKEAIHRKEITFRLIKGENIITELEEYTSRESIDILAVVKTGKTFLERIFIGSVSQKLFHYTNIPLLIFEAKDIPGDLF